jgi:hypothetical protein
MTHFTLQFDELLKQVLILSWYMQNLYAQKALSQLAPLPHPNCISMLSLPKR